MLTADVISKLGIGAVETLYMTLFTTVFGYIIGLPLGVLLAVTGKGGLKENKTVYKVLDFIVNIVRSVPFLILLILLIPYTRAIIGKSYGTTATIVPLVVSAAPFIARMVESSLREVDEGVIEAARSMGAGIFTIITKVMIVEAKTSLIDGATIALGTIFGYSAMAGVVGGGGLGDIAIRYGLYRFDAEKMWITVILLVILVQILQTIGMNISKRTDKRRI
ncbi:D-methionine transport system permease protein MetI [bioreactor metagenome]|uniref:D-methionine transport system permease protein MetI n=1 Tax=bioreactor metagenome TaxID=1076179 RepID=A0A645G3P5_9ZZZZ|nr:methionine ABC transporter permease [Candidatus Metalachnospira sp.]